MGTAVIKIIEIHDPSGKLKAAEDLERAIEGALESLQKKGYEVLEHPANAYITKVTRQETLKIQIIPPGSPR